jgi:hypothetical protein
MRIQEAGCQVILRHCNNWVLGLLRIIGADQFATLIPRKRI